MVKKMKLNIGSGIRPLPDCINLDIEDYSHIGIGKFVRGDFDKKLPFKDDFFDEIIMECSLEHCKDIWFTIKEVHRILKPKGKVTCQVPHFRFPNAYMPLTHHYYFGYNSLDGLNNLFEVRKELQFYCNNETTRKLTRPISWFFNKIPRLYEMTLLCLIFPCPRIKFELIKKIR
jgi:ubiquinone/menaquinone biosynthesis C-methylase UbiE